MPKLVAKPKPEAETPKKKRPGMTAFEQKAYLRKKAGWPPAKGN